MRSRFLLLLLSCWFSVMVAIAQTTTNLMRQVDRDRMEHWVDSVFDSMSYDERIGQLFMIIANPTTDNRNIQRLTKYVNEIKIGGILFHKGNPESQADVTNRMQKLSKVPLWISLDGEWGLSMRLSGTTRFPKNMMLGAIEDNSLIEAYGREVARQCKEMGIHINFAPDIDVNSNEDNPVIGLRSFGESAGAVSDKGLAYARGLEGEGIISVAKHFPGHGDTSADSHYQVPVVKAKIGPKIVNLICDGPVFSQMPVKAECKVKISGLYITEIVKGAVLDEKAMKKRQKAKAKAAKKAEKEAKKG